MCPEEAQLSHISAQYSSREAQIFSYEAKALSLRQTCHELCFHKYLSIPVE